MTDTMIAMEWRIVDRVLVDTLEIGDWIKAAGELVEIISILDDTESDGIAILYENDMDEQYEVVLSWDAMIDVYMLVDSED